MVDPLGRVRRSRGSSCGGVPRSPRALALEPLLGPSWGPLESLFGRPGGLFGRLRSLLGRLRPILRAFLAVLDWLRGGSRAILDSEA
eukprot:4663931-Pyramimonas_sp.AAC.1